MQVEDVKKLYEKLHRDVPERREIPLDEFVAALRSGEGTMDGVPATDEQVRRIVRWLSKIGAIQCIN